MKQIFLLLIVFVIAFAGSSIAQESSLGIGAEVGIPSSGFSDNVETGFGGIATYGYTVNPNIMVTVKSGALFFSAGSKTVHFIPALVGGRYFAMPGDTRFYLSAETGLYFVGASGYESETDFSLIPGLGVQFKTSEKTDVDVHLNYTTLFVTGGTSSWLGLGAGLSFGL